MGNTINPEDHLLHVKAWKSRSNYPVPEDYPESQLPELRSKPNTAIAFSGGGLRAYVSSFGFLAGLRDLGLLENVRYVGGVSSSAWAMAAYCYGDVKDDLIFLGPVIPPELLTLNRLNEMHHQCVKRLATTMIGVVYEGINTVSPDKQAAWNFTVSERFLKPVGITDGKFFTWSKRTLNDIVDRNDHMLQYGLSKDDFLLPRRPGGSYMVLGWSLIGPDRSWIDDQYNAQHNHFRVMDVTPLYMGQFSNEYAHFGTEKFKIGGVYEPFCFALQGGLPPEYGLEYDDSFGELLVPAPRKPLDFTNMISISSYNPGTIFDSYPLPFTEVFLPFTANYWSPAFEEPTMRPTLFADGGAMQNIPLITFIQRGVEKIIALSSSYTPIDYEALQDYGNPSNWIFSKQIRTSYIDVSLASFFGVIPSDLLLAHDVSSEYRRNHVFETDQFAELIEGFHKASLGGKGTMYRGKFLTIDNPYYGVEAGREVDVTFVYMETASEWYELLPEEIKTELTREANIFDGFAAQEFANFPHYDTDKFQFTYRETNLLSSLVGWIVQENEKVFKSVLSHEKSVNFVPPPESDHLKRAKSLFRESSASAEAFQDRGSDIQTEEFTEDDDSRTSGSMKSALRLSELDRVKLGRSLHAKMAVSPKGSIDDKRVFDASTAENPMVARKSIKGQALAMELDIDDGQMPMPEYDDNGLPTDDFRVSSDSRKSMTSPSMKKKAQSVKKGDEEIFENPLMSKKKKGVTYPDEDLGMSNSSNQLGDDEFKLSDDRSSTSLGASAASWWNGLFKPLSSSSSTAASSRKSVSSKGEDGFDDVMGMNSQSDDTFSNPMKAKAKMYMKPKAEISSTAATSSSEPEEDTRNSFHDVRHSLVRQNSSRAVDNPLVKMKMKKAMMAQAKAEMDNELSSTPADETKTDPLSETASTTTTGAGDVMADIEAEAGKPAEAAAPPPPAPEPEPVDETPFLELPPEKMIEATFDAVKRASISIFQPMMDPTPEPPPADTSKPFVKPPVQRGDSIFDVISDAIAPMVEALTPEPMKPEDQEAWFAPAKSLASQFGLDISSWGPEEDKASKDKQLSARELAELKDAENKKSNLIVYDENPFEELEGKSSKTENLTDCKPIPAAMATEFVNKLKAFRYVSLIMLLYTC
jgi:hypothetical protein